MLLSSIVLHLNPSLLSSSIKGAIEPANSKRLPAFGTGFQDIRTGPQVLKVPSDAETFIFGQILLLERQSFFIIKSFSGLIEYNKSFIIILA